MNRILEPTTIHERKNEICDTKLLNRQFLFTKDNEDFYIKYDDHLIPIGGKVKQNYLEAGDNIEIIRDESIEHDHPEILRLLDDIYINTCELGKNTDTYRWKGTYKIGELDNNNAIFILTKKSESVHDLEKAIIGGEILVKMIDDKDTIQYAHYALTCTSTGSWSLAGACATPSNVRMVRCKQISTGDYFYGLRLPKGEYEDYGIVDTPDWETVNLQAYVSLWAGSNINDLRLYTSQTEFKQLTKESHIIDYGFTEGDGYSKDLWTISLSDYDDLLGWTKNNSHMLDADAKASWKEWIDKGYKVGLTLDTKDVLTSAWYVYNTSTGIYLYKEGLTGNEKQPYATYSLFRGNLRYTLTDKGTDASIYGSSVSTYNHWYTMSMPYFFNLLGFTPRGDWAQYNNNNYLFGIRIYTRGTSTRITLVAVLRNNTALTQVRVIGADDLDIEFNWDSDLVNLKSTNNYPATEVYPNLGNGDYVDIFKFVDRTAIPQKHGMQIRATDISLLDSNNQVVSDSFSFTNFDQQFVVDNYSFVSNFTNNRNPIFTTNSENVPTLLYYGETDSTFDDQTTFLGIQKSSYDYIIAHHLEEKKFIDTLTIKHAEFWFNGWRHFPESLMLHDYTDEDFEYTVLSNKSNDNDSYAETKYFGTVAEYEDAKNGLPSMQDTGEDNAPYKIYITQEWLSMQDLLDIAAYIRHLEKQVALDLSNCKVLPDAETWNTAIFEGCVSLREIAIPQGVKEFGQGIFKWCTYLRKLDLTPSASTLTTIGGTAWEQNAGFLVSTRVTQLLIPENVSLLRNYLVYASNLKTLIFLHNRNTGLKEDQSNASEAARVGTLSISEWAWIGQTGYGSIVYDLPEGFHIFFSKDFWENGVSKGNNAGQPNKNGSGWDWYPTKENYSRWNKRVIDSIVAYPQDGTQEEWQEFEDQYHWGEDLINEIRAYYGHENAIEIKERLL